jgi:hypothetical protein
MLKQFKIIVIILVVSISTSDFVFAQKNPVHDSTQIYKNIESYSRRRKFTIFIYHMIFKPVAIIAKSKKAGKKVNKKLIQKPYSLFEGKTIRHITIETLDPFGYSITDTATVHPGYATKKANQTHVKSQNITIRNLLLIHKNQLFDPLLVKESERLVRSQHYVRDVAFFVTSTSAHSDSVDIYIRELDKWSLIPVIEASTSNITFKVTDNNFLGLGHEFKNGLTWYHTNGDYAFNTNYFIPNIRNTFINTTLHYGKDEYRNFTKSLDVDRPFFSPLAKWAAGVNISQQFHGDSIYTIDSGFVTRKYRFNSQDFWIGHAVQIFKGQTETKRTTNLISAVRYLRIRYLEEPIPLSDPLQIFTNEDFYLASIGISTRKYVQDKFIFRFGIPEDVPVGKVFNLTGGYQNKNNVERLYLDALVSYGNYYPWGYLSSSFEYGSFFKASQSQQAVFLASVNFFSNLIEIGKWKFRQFAKPQFIAGINRFSSDTLTLNDGYGLDGFNSSGLIGIKRVIFTLQTQSYCPWSIIGFHFGPYITCSIGMLGNEQTSFKQSKVYSQFGFGVLIKNENLVINTFQLSFSFFPSIPGQGENIFKGNTFRTTDFGFRDFVIGKPAAQVFQ